MADRPFVYVCSPLRGEIEANMARAREYCRQVFEVGYNPVCPQIFYTQFLRDDVMEEREAGMDMGLALLTCCHAIVVCGDELTTGMKLEVTAARRLEIPIYSLDIFLHEQSAGRKPSVLERMAADRAERAATQEKGAPVKRKSNGQEH